MSDELQIIDPKKEREENEVVVDLGNGKAVRCRKLDLTALVFEGKLPLPLLAAVQKMMDMPNATAMERLDALGKERSKELLRVVQEHAVNVIIAPTVSMEDTGDPDTFPVSYFKLPQLMAIWTRTAVVPRFTTAQAAEFRGKPVTDDAAPARAVEDVPSAPEQLVSGVEYRGL